MEREKFSPENPKQELITGLRRLKTDYKDGIPDETKHSTDDDSGWKVQKGWFQKVIFNLEDVMEKQQSREIAVSKELLKEIEIYIEKITARGSALKNRPTSQEDINEAENIIEKTITELDN